MSGVPKHLSLGIRKALDGIEAVLIWLGVHVAPAWLIVLGPGVTPPRTEFPSRPHSHSFAWGEYMASERLLNPARCTCNSHLIDSARSGSDPLTSEFSSYPHSDSFSTGECRGTLLIRTRPPLGPP